ncbi:MAG: lytic murein transglycosylase, partial [Pseudomonadota bacterium]
MRLLALLLILATTPSRAEELSAWLTDFRPRAEAAGIYGATLDRALPGIEHLPDVIRRDRNQSEFSKTIWDYLDSAVSNLRVQNGRAALQRHAAAFDAIEARYGVEKEIVAAIWGLESSYGAFRGDTSTLSALATLAADSRRGPFFETQLIAAL